MNGAVIQVPMKDREKLFRKYIISAFRLRPVSSKKRYYKIQRHRTIGEFAAAVSEILSHQYEAGSLKNLLICLIFNRLPSY